MNPGLNDSGKEERVHCASAGDMYDEEEDGMEDSVHSTPISF
jgi:hypothetical protein